jgi:hypothetical protein
MKTKLLLIFVIVGFLVEPLLSMSIFIIYSVYVIMEFSVVPLLILSVFIIMDCSIQAYVTFNLKDYMELVILLSVKRLLSCCRGLNK